MNTVLGKIIYLIYTKRINEVETHVTSTQGIVIAFSCNSFVRRVCTVNGRCCQKEHE